MTFDRNENLLQTLREAIVPGSGEAEISSPPQQNVGTHRVTLRGGDYR